MDKQLCDYELEYYSSLSVCLSQLMFVILLIFTVNLTGCTVLTMCDGQLAVPASNCTLCVYVLEYYSALSVCLSQLMFVILLISTVNVTDCTVLTVCDGQLAVPASNCTLCVYVLEYYSTLSVCLSQLMFVILLISLLM